MKPQHQNNTATAASAGAAPFIFWFKKYLSHPKDTRHFAMLHKTNGCLFNFKILKVKTEDLFCEQLREPVGYLSVPFFFFLSTACAHAVTQPS